MSKANHGGSCGGIFSLGLSVAVLLYLLLQPSTALPVSSIEDFTIYALKDATNNSSHNNHTIHYDLKLTNSGSNVIYYDALKLTFYYKPNNNLTSFIVGNTTFIPFYQRRLRDNHFVGNIETREVNWENATAPVTLRAELATTMRYRFRRNRLYQRLSNVVGADLKVDGEGNLVNKGIQLTSRAEMNVIGRFQFMGILLCILFFFQSW